MSAQASSLSRLHRALLLGAMLTVSISIFFSAPQAQAQLFLLEPLLGVERLSLSSNPQFPSPGQQVIATVSSTMVDVSRSIITWTENGKAVAASNGNNTHTFTAGKSGSRTLIRVNVRTPEGETLTKQITVISSAVDLIWQTSSYVPPFYQGKALTPVGNPVTVVALPDIRTNSGRKLAASELTFNWKQNGRILGSLSGRGKDAVTLPGPEIYKSFNLLVEITSSDGLLGAVGVVAIQPVVPQVLLYESHPTLGVRYEKAIADELVIREGEVMLAAKPFFFATTETGDVSATYLWKINGTAIQNPSGDPSLIILRPTGAGGSARIEVAVKHTSQIFQQAASAFRVDFTGDETLPLTSNP